jgi:hypothetical protein
MEELRAMLCMIHSNASFHRAQLIVLWARGGSGAPAANRAAGAYHCDFVLFTRRLHSVVLLVQICLMSMNAMLCRAHNIVLSRSGPQKGFARKLAGGAFLCELALLFNLLHTVALCAPP